MNFVQTDQAMSRHFVNAGRTIADIYADLGIKLGQELIECSEFYLVDTPEFEFTRRDGQYLVFEVNCLDELQGDLVNVILEHLNVESLGSGKNFEVQIFFDDSHY